MKNTHSYKKINKLMLLICILGISVFLSLHGLAQESEDESEGPDLTREAQVALVAAQELMQQEDFTNARTPIIEYLATQPEVVPEVAFLMLGQLWYGDDSLDDDTRLNEAMKVFKQGSEAYPESENILINYAVVTYELENFSQAARLFERLYDISKEKDVENLYRAAVSFYTSEELEEAKRVFKRMIDLPGEAKTEWYDTIISICMEQEKVDEAETYILQALEVYPLKMNYWQLLANMRIEREDYRGAASALEIGYTVEPPKEKKDWTNLFDLYTYLNVPMRIAKNLEEILEKNASEQEDHIRIAKAYASSHRIEKAVAYLDKIISQEPSVKLVLEKARILYDARRNNEAIKVLDECIALDPLQYEAYMLKGFAAWDLKDWDLARDAFENAQGSKQYGRQAEDALAVMDDLDRAKAE
jgi:tetratricopeptide (TPR) repeat protein